MLRQALKEWAVICRALAEGRQAIILRKGGIEDAGGSFRVEHTRFWLYPTYVHQQPDGLKPHAQPLLAEVQAGQPPAGVLRLAHFAEVEGVYHVHNLAGALAIDELHLWSPQTVASRFAYRRPGLYVLAVRVHRAAGVFEVPELSAYAGCRSWVELDRDLPDEQATPVLDDEAFRKVLANLDDLLNPTALA
jgi:hypothetical protein